MKFLPGPGLGGHCIPVDPQYLSWKMRTLGYTARFIELATDINQSMPDYWVHKVQDSLNGQGKAIRGSHVLVIGVAYKANVSDLREAPALDIIGLLLEKGAEVSYHDSHVPAFSHEGKAFKSVPDLYKTARGGRLHPDYRGPRRVRLGGDSPHWQSRSRLPGDAPQADRQLNFCNTLLDTLDTL